MASAAILEVLDNKTISPYKEIMAYETLYAQEGSTLKKVAEATSKIGRLPSQALEEQCGLFGCEHSTEVEEYLQHKIGTFSIAIKNTPSWPTGLEDAKNPSPIIYYKGDIGLLESKSVSVVGARKATAEGRSRAFKIAKELVANGITIVTGLAEGIDHSAIEGAIDSNGRIIGVIGTPIDEYYPRDNKQIQDYVADKQLLISQVPLYKYSVQSFNTKRYYFPERNELMAAISSATIIVEASDTSGSLTQARACLHQGRPLFIMESCMENPAITWPAKYANRDGVHVVRSVEDILVYLGD